MKVVNVRDGLMAQMGFSEGYIIVSVNQKKDKSAKEMISIWKIRKVQLSSILISPEGERSVTQFYFN